MKINSQGQDAFFYVLSHVNFEYVVVAGIFSISNREKSEKTKVNELVDGQRRSFGLLCLVSSLSAQLS